jgi:hypothetical protein
MKEIAKVKPKTTTVRISIADSEALTILSRLYCRTKQQVLHDLIYEAIKRESQK